MNDDDENSESRSKVQAALEPLRSPAAAEKLAMVKEKTAQRLARELEAQEKRQAKFHAERDLREKLSLRRVTVSQLVDTLRAFPPGTVVELEGCDCNGFASGECDAFEDADGPRVLLRRSDAH